MARSCKAYKILLKIGLNDPHVYAVKVWRNLEGFTIEANHFVFKVNPILGFGSIHPDGLVAKIGLNGPDDK